MKKRQVLRKSEVVCLSDLEIVIDGVIAEGMNSIVYKAHDITDGSTYKLKELYPSGSEISNGRIEYSNAAENRFHRINELQNSIEEQKSDERNNSCFSILKNSRSFYQIFSCDNKQDMLSYHFSSINEILMALRKICEMLFEYHRAGYLHLGIKPENIFIDSTTGCISSDFSLSITDNDSIIDKTEVYDDAFNHIMTYRYAAPELRMRDYKRVSEKSDYYSVGALLFAALMKRLPVASDREYNAFREYDRTSVLLKSVSFEFFDLLDEFLNHTLCSYIKCRYNTSSELIETIDRLIELS